MGKNFALLTILTQLAPVVAGEVAAQPAAPAKPASVKVIEVRKIWDQAPHNAFTDLTRFRGRWYCAFREGKAHASPDGALRLLRSSDGKEWASAALLSHPSADLRDPKLSVTPEGRLMLNAVAAFPAPAEIRHQSLAWFSADGAEWSPPARIGPVNVWLWRIAWRGKIAYSVGYATVPPRFVALYAGEDGINFQPLVKNLFDRDYPNEASVVFMDDGTALCLLRRDAGPATAQLGTALPPFQDWSWKDLGVRVGGPHMVRLPDKRFVVAARLYDKHARTSLCWLDPDQGRISEFYALPSGGDTSYAGLVFHRGALWISYYSSHEGKASIYVARIKLPEKRR